MLPRQVLLLPKNVSLQWLQSVCHNFDWQLACPWSHVTRGWIGLWSSLVLLGYALQLSLILQSHRTLWLYKKNWNMCVRACVYVCECTLVIIGGWCDRICLDIVTDKALSLAGDWTPDPSFRRAVLLPTKPKGYIDLAGRQEPLFISHRYLTLMTCSYVIYYIYMHYYIWWHWLEKYQTNYPWKAKSWNPYWDILHGVHLV